MVGWMAGKQATACGPLTTTHLVRPADEVEVVPLEEGLHDVLAEGEGHAALVLAPPDDLLVGVRPQQVAEEARVWCDWVGVVVGGWDEVGRGQTDRGMVVGVCVCVWGGGGWW